MSSMKMWKSSKVCVCVCKRLLWLKTSRQLIVCVCVHISKANRLKSNVSVNNDLQFVR